jgi:hypothetical protein
LLSSAVPGFQDAICAYVLHSINITLQHTFQYPGLSHMLHCYSYCYFAVPGFQDAIRAYVLHSISITFQRVSVRVLGDWLKLEGSALQQLLADKVREWLDYHALNTVT